MRAIILIPVVGLAGLLVAAAFYVRMSPQQSTPAPVLEPATEQTAVTTPAVPPILARVNHRPPAVGRPDRPAESDISKLGHADYVTQRKAQLIEMGSGGNPAVLPNLLAEMENPDPEIRRAALNATVELGNKDAIPALQSELGWATDLQEKVAIQNAIDFLQLPSFGAGSAVAGPSSGDIRLPN